MGLSNHIDLNLSPYLEVGFIKPVRETKNRITNPAKYTHLLSPMSLQVRPHDSLFALHAAEQGVGDRGLVKWRLP